MADKLFKATDEDWAYIEWAGGITDAHSMRTIRELRDRVAALEAAPDRVLVRNQTGEYVRAGTPVYMATPPELDADAVLSLAAIIRSVDGAHNLGAAALAEAILSHPDATGVLQLPHDPLRQGLQDQLIADLSDEELVAMWINDGRSTGEGLRFVWDHGFQHGLAAGRAEQGSSQGILDDSTPEPEPVDPQTLHGIALDMVDSLRPIVIPEILNTLRRAIREPMAEPTPEPEPNQAPAGDGGLVEGIRGLLGHQFDRVATNTMARAVLLAVAQWLRSMGHRCAATELEREARR
jgi:hypothetical protein